MEQENSLSKKNLQKLISSPEGKRLMELLSADGGKTLQQASAALKKGNETEAQKTIAPMLKNPEVQKLMCALEKLMGNG